jgi:hypothetical protein
MPSKTFQELIQQTQAAIDEFEKIEQRPWGIEGTMIELSKQVGDLAKRVMVAEKYYLKNRENSTEYDASKEKIADELYDLWYCVVRITDYYQIDLENTIDKTTQSDLLKLKEEKM